ncbi:uncharacterized protein LOC109712387 [Ananas comosus]|uniref:Uncharacterized protein LOC109712387 n=1 Tax=Ananas comosus TaxID=4615 RepID=A0A6P5F5T9_ANACO|nr:uncharacterized protein LOC109712387 [Ananas comosus]
MARRRRRRAAYYNVSYARSQPANPSVSYEHRPRSPETIHRHYADAAPAPYEPSASSSSSAYPYHGYPYPAQPSSDSYPYPGPYMSYGGNGGGGGGFGGYFGSASPPPYGPPPAAAAPPASRAPPPPPPSPPRPSTWDFLNPFEVYDSYYASSPYTPSRSSKEVREEEGIPDLEDEEHEVVKEAYGDRKSSASVSAPEKGDLLGKGVMGVSSEEGRISIGEGSSSGSSISSGHDVHVVEKSVVGNEVQKPEDVRRKATRTYHDDSEVAEEIKAQFEKASESANQLSKMLEVGKRPYLQKKSLYKVSVRMICGLPSLPSSSMNEDLMHFEEDKAMGCGNLSSTLQKLYMWESKLLEEVKAEEKMRVLYDQKREELRHLIDRGAEAHKLEESQTYIRKLSTRIRIAIQVVDSISKKISQLRDEELWPQICELVQGFMRMWGTMLECHQTQWQAISEAKSLDSIISGGKLSDAHVEATKKLELELLEWITAFSSWVSMQRSYIKALNGWLVKGLNYVPEETDDGVPPFSPGRLGAPPVFVICNYWSQSMDRVSEREVVETMLVFASSIFHLWEKHKFEQRQRLMANKDLDKTLRVMEREEQFMHKALDEQNRKLALISSQSGVPLSGPAANQELKAEIDSLQSILRQVFEAMENFTSSFAKAYEALHTRSEEEKGRFVRENVKVS